MKDYSNYHSVNINDKMTHDGLLLLQNSLDGFEGYDVLLNDTKSTKVLFYQKYDSEGDIKKVIGHVEDIELGNILKINNDNWMIITYPEDNKVYRKAEIQLCNEYFKIQTGETKTISGYDDLGRPIYTTTPSFLSVPCIVSNITYTIDNEQAVNIVDGKVKITIQNTTNQIDIGYKFDLFNEQYVIVGLDKTKTFTNVGVIQIIADKV